MSGSPNPAEVPPQLPSEVSRDGREIWAWGHELSKWAQRQDKIEELRASIADLSSRCGTCFFWMKSRDCPREHNVNGRNVGPSCNSAPCSKFQEERWVTELRKERQTEMDALLKNA